MNYTWDWQYNLVCDRPLLINQKSVYGYSSSLKKKMKYNYSSMQFNLDFWYRRHHWVRCVCCLIARINASLNWKVHGLVQRRPGQPRQPQEDEIDQTPKTETWPRPRPRGSGFWRRSTKNEPRKLAEKRRDQSGRVWVRFVKGHSRVRF